MDRVKRQLGCSEELQYSHPDFEDRVIAFQDFVNGRQGFYDDSGHGTHVAGCIGGSGRLSNGRFSGIAPTCRLCVGKVLDEKGEGSIESMYHGLLWVLENRLRYRIRVLNISVGIGEDGNSVITVGCNEGGYFGLRKDLCENYSGRAREGFPYRKPDLVAPGTDVVSCNLTWRKNRRGVYRDTYTKKSGTSMATPIVSGAAALYLQKYPYSNSSQVKRQMVYTARDLGEAWYRQGWGMLDIEKLCSYY